MRLVGCFLDVMVSNYQIHSKEEHLVNWRQAYGRLRLTVVCGEQSLAGPNGPTGAQIAEKVHSGPDIKASEHTVYHNLLNIFLHLVGKF